MEEDYAMNFPSGYNVKNVTELQRHAITLFVAG
jgi:hypothetical protein